MLPAPFMVKAQFSACLSVLRQKAGRIPFSPS